MALAFGKPTCAELPMIYSNNCNVFELQQQSFLLSSSPSSYYHQKRLFSNKERKRGYWIQCNDRHSNCAIREKAIAVRFKLIVSKRIYLNCLFDMLQ